MKTKLNKYRKQSLDTGINASKEVVHKIGEFLENKKADAVAKLHDNKIVKADKKQQMLKKKNYSIRKKRRNIKRIKTIIKL